MQNIALIFGGPSAEHEISILTGLQAGRILRDAGTTVQHIYWTRSASFQLVPDELEAADFLDPDIRGAVPIVFDPSAGFMRRGRLAARPLEIDIVLNCCHGGPGEDGSLTAMLALAGLRVSGPSATACAITMDKLATTAIAERLGIATIPTQLLDARTEAIDLPAPWIVKPRYGGSSIGVEAGIEDTETARAIASQGACRSGALVQPFLDTWQDLNVSVRTHPELEVTPIERPLRGDQTIYSYAEKYLAGGDGMESAPRELPADVPASVASEVVSATRRLAVELGLTGIARVDFLWDPESDAVKLCEVNAIPGALGLYLWEAAGHSRADVLRGLVAEASSSSPQPWYWAPSTDVAALRAAGSIAAKLA